MKVLNKKLILMKNKKCHTMAEGYILSNMVHPNLIHLNYSFQTDAKIYFIMEFMKGGELFYHLKKVKRFTEE